MAGIEFAKLIDVLKEQFQNIEIEFIREPEITSSKKSSVSDQKNDSDFESGEKPSLGGIRIFGRDKHKTLLTYVKLNADQFVDFCVEPESYKITLDIIKFHKFMKTVDKDSIMRMYVNVDDKKHLTIELQNTVKNNTSVFKQKLLDCVDEKKNIPNTVDFDMTVIIDTTDFRKVCQEMYQFSEHVEITCTSKAITYQCKDDSVEYVKTFHHSDCEGGVNIATLVKDAKASASVVQGIFNLKHLVIFGKCATLCSEMQLFLRNNYPLFINYKIGRLGKMLVGLLPVDETTIKRDNDENMDQYHEMQKKDIINDE